MQDFLFKFTSMEGIVFGSFTGGWLCSNECFIDVEKDFNVETKVMTTTMVLKVKGIFVGKGNIIKDLSVSLVVRNEKGENLGFNGYIRAITENKTSIVLTTKHNKVTELLNHLNKEIHNGR